MKKLKTKYSKKAGYSKKEREKYEYIDEMSEKIQDAIESNGAYSHNIVSLCLSSVAEKYGNAAANNLIYEHNLKSLYGIEPIKEGE